MDPHGARLLGSPGYFRSDIERSIMPNMEPHEYQTFSMKRPLRTHWRETNDCSEFECDGYLYGFVLTVDTNTDLGKKQFNFVTHDKTRRPSMQRIAGGIVKFVYGPGFNCFSRPHKIAIGRPPLFIVSGGDWRGNPRRAPTRRHTRGEFWVEEFEEAFDTIRTIKERG